METFIKLSDTSFKTRETKEVEQTYDYKELVERRDLILKRWSLDTDEVNKEIAKLDSLIAEAKKLGLGEVIKK
jgi:hypothetical protein